VLSDSVRGKGTVNAILLNEFLKEHKKAEEQARINQQQQATNRPVGSNLEGAGRRKSRK